MSSFIRQRGKGKNSPFTAYWHAVDPATGKRVQYSKGGFRIKKDAQAHLNEVMGKVQNNTFQRDTKITVAQLLNEQWLPTKKTEDLAASTLQQYADIIEHWIGGIQAQNLTPKQVTDWREALKNTRTSTGRAGLSPRSISASVGVLKAAFKWGAINGVIPRDPIAAVARTKKDAAVKPDKAWTGDEAKRFLKFTAEDRRLHPIWQLALVGGLRRGELCGLKWEDVDFQKGSVRIVRTRVCVNGRPEASEPKTKGSRRVLSLSPVMPLPKGAPEPPEGRSAQGSRRGLRRPGLSRC
jgi:integrase